MSDHHDAQDYTANGPTGVGFATGGDGTGIVTGVLASGTRTGVHGKGVGEGDGATPPNGVIGESRNGFGVVGSSDFYVGVQGNGPTGVKGFSREREGVFGLGPTGVRGHSSRADFRPADAEEEIGVLGEGRDVGVLGEGSKGAGVEGHSYAGAGVRGHSDTIYGGAFASQFAQLRLEPAALLFGPPVAPKSGPQHRKGEFFVDRRGALFYCYTESPPRWQQIAGPSWVSDTVTTAIKKLKDLIFPGRQDRPGP